MDLIIIIIAGLLMILGILGSFLPVIPGPFTSWVGLVVLYLAKTIPTHLTLIIVTCIIAIIISVLDYIIPSISTKRFGGTKGIILKSCV